MKSAPFAFTALNIRRAPGFADAGFKVEQLSPGVNIIYGPNASGKSTFARLFLATVPDTAFFDCDACVQELLARPAIIDAIAASLGDDLRKSDGSLDRALLRARVFASDEIRHRLEGILHPLVREACAEARQQAADGGTAPFFLADVPLLYESGFPLDRDLDIVVACDPATQRTRLKQRSGFDEATIDRILAAQLPIMDKVKRAGVVLWNGGTPDSLERQTAAFVRRLTLDPDSQDAGV